MARGRGCVTAIRIPKLFLVVLPWNPRPPAMLAKCSPAKQYSCPLEPAGRGRKMPASLKVCLQGTAGHLEAAL